MLIDFIQLVVLFISGTLVGFINVLAGGGSLLSLPLLIFLGLPPTVANGTNRIAILMQNSVAIYGFHRFRVIPWQISFLSASVAFVGAIIGATYAIDISDVVFKRLLAAVIIIVMTIIIIDPAQRIQHSDKPLTGLGRMTYMLAFFGVGLYGGFIQAGVGFQVIIVMLMAGYNLVVANAVKVFVIFCFTMAAVVVFILNDKVDFALGVTLGLGNALGGFLATKVAVKKGHTWIRIFLIVVGVAFSGKLLIDTFFLE